MKILVISIDDKVTNTTVIYCLYLQLKKIDFG